VDYREPAVFLLGVLGLGNLAFSIPRLGTSLYNYNLALQPLIAFAIESIPLSLVFCAVRATPRSRWSPDQRGQPGGQ